MQKLQFLEISCLVKLQVNTPQSTLFDCFRWEQSFPPNHLHVVACSVLVANFASLS